MSFWLPPSESTNVTVIGGWQHLPKLNFSHGNINALLFPPKAKPSIQTEIHKQIANLTFKRKS